MEKKTAAASVEDTIAPNNKPSVQLIPLTPKLKLEKLPRISHAKLPTKTAVIQTPKVERSKPSLMIGRICRHLLSNPPEKKE